MLAGNLVNILKRVTAHPTELTVVATMLCFLAWTGWTGWQIGQRMASPAPLQSKDPSPQAVEPAIDYHAIANAPIFGAPDAENSQRDAVKTDLALTLRAVFAATNQDFGAAIIEVSGQSPRYYKVGDRIAGGAELHEVLKDRVVMKRENRLEILAFPIPGSEIEATSTNETVHAEVQSVAPQPTSNPGASDYSALAAYVGGESTADTIRKRLEELRKRAQEARAQRQAQPDQGE